MLAIVEANKYWHHYLEGLTYLVCMIIDHYNP